MGFKNAVGTWIVALALLAPPLAAHAQGRAAEIVSLKGEASAVAITGASRGLRRGSSLFQGDRVETQEDSALVMRFTDGTRFDLGEKSAMSVDAYAYQENAESNSFSASVFKGVFRFVSGLIAKRRSRSMGVRTPVATIGIRGTSVAGEADATSSTIMLLEPEEDEGPTAIEVSNQFGSVTIDEPGFGTEIPDASSPPSPPRRMQLRTIQNLQRTLQSIGRIRPPRIR